MAGKKPGSKPSKVKKPPSAKVAPRKVEPRKAATTASSRKAVAATSVKAEVKGARKPAVAHEHPGATAERRTPERAEAPIRAAAPEAAHPAKDPSVTARTRALHEAEEAEAESEGGEISSLLAGPRNVKPYVAKRGELYMSKEQLTHFQHILSTWKRDLMEEVDRTVSHMKDEAANFPDPNDRATQEEEFSLELRTRDRERKLIRKIDEALKRIEDGTYGYCLETGEEIGIKRLEARPVATLSIEAQERRERRERQYGDRDDRYR
ncbi:MAG TPA: RNA polymerase-binding protein DksA [Steroidobacteraceae bacterium]|jgi:DnaK suppressor protein|nr:RNA polymerase-binding protein DksA [Steroidobacteraceae bacterium]